MKNKKKFTVKADRTPKTIEVAVLQGNYGYGWDDLFEFEKGATYSEIKRAKKEYDDNEPQYAHRIIHRRVPNPEYQKVSTDLNMSSGITSSTNNRLKRCRKPIKAAKRMSDVFDGYEPWSGAKDTAAALDRFDKWDALEAFIDDAYYNEAIGEGLIGETELNDLLWFEPEYIAEAVGLYYDVETDEWSDEPFDEDSEEDE